MSIRYWPDEQLHFCARWAQKILLNDANQLLIRTVTPGGLTATNLYLSSSDSIYLMFHEALHSGGLKHEPDHPSDFNDLEKCMGCSLSVK